MADAEVKIDDEVTTTRSITGSVLPKLDVDYKKYGLIGAGFLLGTVGLKILGSKDAKKAYAHVAAAALRAKDCALTTVAELRENADDILAEARDINAAREFEAVSIIDDVQDDMSKDTAEGTKAPAHPDLKEQHGNTNAVLQE